MWFSINLRFFALLTLLQTSIKHANIILFDDAFLNVFHNYIHLIQGLDGICVIVVVTMDIYVSQLVSGRVSLLAWILKRYFAPPWIEKTCWRCKEHDTPWARHDMHTLVFVYIVYLPLLFGEMENSTDVCMLTATTSLTAQSHTANWTICIFVRCAKCLPQVSW